MKKNVLSGVVLLSLSFSSFTTFATAKTPVKAEVKCAQREDQIADIPSVNDFVSKIGGIRNLEGDWKLGGFAGAFKYVLVSFQSTASGLNALVDGLSDKEQEPKRGPISVCETIRADTLLVKVLKTNDALYMRAGKNGTLQLAQIKNNKVGTFYTFDKQ